MSDPAGSGRRASEAAREVVAARADTPGGLRDFQRVMFRAVTRPLADDASNPVWDDGREADAVLSVFVKGDGDRGALERVQTYNRMYWYRTLDSLAEDFPGVRAILGERFFPEAEAYLENHPSTSFTLRHLGRRFPAWLLSKGARRGDSAMRAAADCAAVEWALCHAFEAADGVAPVPTGGRDPSAWRFAVCPHVTLIRSAYAIPEFLDTISRTDSAGDSEANAAHLPGEASADESGARMPRRAATCVVVYRSPDFVLRAERMAPAPFRFLSMLASGESLGRALDRMAESGRVPSPGKVRGWFHAWSAKGLLVPVNP